MFKTKAIYSSAFIYIFTFQSQKAVSFVRVTTLAFLISELAQIPKTADRKCSNNKINQTLDPDLKYCINKNPDVTQK